MQRNKIAHVSFDDVCDVLLDITRNENIYSSIFNNLFLSQLKDMHEKFSAKFVLFIYEKNAPKEYDIAKVTKNFKQEFEDNSDWLRFGYHSIEPTTLFDHSVDIAEFERSYIKTNKIITESLGKNVTTLRLHRFKADAAKVAYLYKSGVRGLLCADDDRGSYDLTDDKVHDLRSNEFVEFNGITYFKTDLRFDKKLFIFFDMWKLRNRDFLVLFAHEWAFKKDLNLIRGGVKWLNNNGYKFSFLNL